MITEQIIQATPTEYRFSENEVLFCQRLALQRRQNYPTSTPLSPHSELIGMLGETTVFKCLGYSDQWILEHLNGSLKKGDQGCDLLTSDGLKVDIKTCKIPPKGYGERFVLSKTNKNRNKADIYLFVGVDITQGKAVGKVYGWCHVFKALLHRQQVNIKGIDFYRLRLYTLEKAGLIKPLSELNLRKENH